MDSAHTPMSAPPPGVTSNFRNPVSQAKAIKSVTIICMVFVSITFAMRIYSRLWIQRTFKKDDLTCLLAVAGTIAYAAITLSTLSVAGKHQWDVPATEFDSRFIKILVIGLVMGYQPVMFFVKLSLFILYLHLFGVKHRIRILIYAGIGSIFMVYTGILIGYGVFCIPRSGMSWSEAIKDPRCHVHTPSIQYIVGIFGVLSDFYILGLPIPVILRLQVPRKERIGLFALFMTGLLACIASILGLYFRIRPAGKGGDLSWNLGFTETIVIVELSVGIICSCLPIMPPIFRRQNLGFLPFVKSRPKLAFQNTFHRMKDQRPAGDVHLDTGILGSAFGDGKFLGTSEFSSNKEESLSASDDDSLGTNGSRVTGGNINGTGNQEV